MDACDVLIVGGGPAGAACAWSLRNSGLDTVVADAATFPRDKVCAGWITPQVVDDLQIDTAQYQKTRVFQPITGFRVGIVGGDAVCHTSYDHPVSFAVRRCEFDHYLLTRCQTRVASGVRVANIRRFDGRWIVNDTFQTPMLVGAGGHWCPVARLLNPRPCHDALIAAQEFECLLGSHDVGRCRVEPGIVEIYFCRDLSGYGWCVRKGNYLNVGFGCYGARDLPLETTQFVEFLNKAGRIPNGLAYRWRGHAYSTHSRPRLVDDGVLLVGDAAAIADPRSGEGIRPAVESGLLAGSTIVNAMGNYAAGRLAPYAMRLHQRFEAGAPLSRNIWGRLSGAMSGRLAAHLLRLPWFVRRILLDRWFLHAAESPLVSWSATSMHSEAG